MKVQHPWWLTWRLGVKKHYGGGFKYFLFSPLFGEGFQSKLFGITYLVGKIKFKLLFHGPKWLSKDWSFDLPFLKLRAKVPENDWLG